MSRHFQVLIAGGGTAGISVAARLANQDPNLNIGLIEPSSKHYYQPLWTLVGGGVCNKQESERDEVDYIPFGTTWIQDTVASFDPDHNTVLTGQGEALTYDYLVVALGIQLDWDKVEGLKAALGSNGITSNYAYEHTDYTWECVKNFKGGTALFTQPGTPIKCAGAPQKALYLSEDYFRSKLHVRNQTKMVFCSGLAGIFGVPKYKAALQKVLDRKQITDTHYRTELVAVDAAKKEAHFKHLDTGESKVIAFDMLHAVPPQSPPDVIKQSPLAGEGGWVEVDKYTTQHVRYPNVFSLGDCSSLPTSRTGAAVRKEAPVTAANLLSHMQNQALVAKYDGYASCPLVTGYGSLILAEFDYSGQPTESFPFDQAKERFSMYMLKVYGLPQMYWHGMLRGQM